MKAIALGAIVLATALSACSQKDDTSKAPATATATNAATPSPAANDPIQTPTGTIANGPVLHNVEDPSMKTGQASNLPANAGETAEALNAQDYRQKINDVNTANRAMEEGAAAATR